MQALGEGFLSVVSADHVQPPPLVPIHFLLLLQTTYRGVVGHSQPDHCSIGRVTTVSHHDLCLAGLLADQDTKTADHCRLVADAVVVDARTPQHSQLEGLLRRQVEVRCGKEGADGEKGGHFELAFKFAEGSPDESNCLSAGPDELFARVDLKAGSDLQLPRRPQQYFLAAIEELDGVGRALAYDDDGFRENPDLGGVFDDDSDVGGVGRDGARVLHSEFAAGSGVGDGEEEGAVEVEAGTAADRVVGLRQGDAFGSGPFEEELVAGGGGHAKNGSRPELEAFVHGERDFIREVFVAGLEAGGDDPEVAGGECAHDQDVALEARLLDVLAGAEGEVELRVGEGHALDDLAALLESPLEVQSFQTGEGVLVGVVREQLQFLDLPDVHHPRLSGDRDLHQSPDTHRDVEHRLARSVGGGDVAGGGVGPRPDHLNDCLLGTAGPSLQQRGRDHVGRGGGPGIASGRRGDELEGEVARGVCEFGQEEVEVVDFGGGGSGDGEQQQEDRHFNSHSHLTINQIAFEVASPITSSLAQMIGFLVYQPSPGKSCSDSSFFSRRFGFSACSPFAPSSSFYFRSPFSLYCRSLLFSLGPWRSSYSAAALTLKAARSSSVGLLQKAFLSSMSLMVESISLGLLGGSSLSFWNWLMTSMPWEKSSSSGFSSFFFSLACFLGASSSTLLFLLAITVAPPLISFCHSFPNTIGPGAFSRFSCSWKALGRRLWQQEIKFSQRSSSWWLGLRLMKSSRSFSNLAFRSSSLALRSSSALRRSYFLFSYSSFSFSFRFSQSSFSFFRRSSSSLRALTRTTWSLTQSMQLSRSCWSSQLSTSRLCLSRQSSMASSRASRRASRALMRSSYSFLISSTERCSATVPCSFFFCLSRASSSARMACDSVILTCSSDLMALSSLQRMSIWSLSLPTSDSISMLGLAFCRARFSSLISLQRRAYSRLLMSLVVRQCSFCWMRY